jgi:hypothetical protein
VRVASWHPPLREEGPEVPVPHHGHRDGAPNADSPADAPPSSLSGRCSECKAISRCGFLCKECGKRVIPFPPKPKPSGQSNIIPY